MTNTSPEQPQTPAGELPVSGLISGIPLPVTSDNDDLDFNFATGAKQAPLTQAPLLVEPPVLNQPELSPWEMSLTDGYRRFSNSEIQTFKRCRRKWYLAYYRRFQPRVESPVGARAIGDRIHRALRWHYEADVTQRVPVRDALELIIASDFDAVRMQHTGGLVPLSLDTQLKKEADLERIMIAGYLEWLAETGADSDYEFIGSEEYLEADLPGFQNVKIIARLDARVRRISDGVRLFIDHKALRNGTPVLTPTGWQPIEQLSVSDVVVAGDGSHTKVTGVYPQGEVDLFRVTFSDGATIDCCGDHLWFAQRFTRKQAEVISTRQLMSDLKNHNGFHEHNVWHIPITAVDLDETRTHDIDPYVIGVWIGDGCRMTTAFASADSEIAARVAAVIKGTGLHLKTEVVSDTHNAYKINSDTHINHLTRELKRLELWSRYSYERFIPDEYLRSSRINRLALLHGLMDADGSIRTKTKQVVYTTTSPQLCNDVAFLVQSLGGIATPANCGPGKYTHNGEVRVCRTVYQVSIALPADVNPFSLSRKAEIFDTKKRRHLKRWITNITPIERDQATCISVANSSKLYITKDMIVTHNTVADINGPKRTLRLNEQMLTYILIEMLQRDDDSLVEGALYNMLRRVKRTGTAKPPFYERVIQRHNRIEINNFLTRLQGTVVEIERVRAELDANPDAHRQFAFPTPGQDCTWSCNFLTIDTLMDDGSHWEAMAAQAFHVGDPSYYYVKGTTI